jgi:putative intracellular protease/amidase
VRTYSDVTKDLVRKSGAFEDIAAASNFDAVFIPGGHGPYGDMFDDAKLQKFIADVYEHGGVVASVCHGPVALCNVKLSTGGHLISGKKVRNVIIGV